MAVKTYIRAMSYETLMRRAFRLNERSINKGTDSSVYENLFHIKEGINFVKGNTYEKQFKKVQGFLLKAMDSFIKLKPDAELKTELSILRSRVQNAYSEEELYSIIERTLDITYKYKNFS